jgi:hypothetical protein
MLAVMSLAGGRIDAGKTRTQPHSYRSGSLPAHGPSTLSDRGWSAASTQVLLVIQDLPGKIVGLALAWGKEKAGTRHGTEPFRGRRGCELPRSTGSRNEDMAWLLTP